MRIKRQIALLLTLIMVFSLLQTAALADGLSADPLALPDKPSETYKVKLDGKELSVDCYTVTYVANPIAAKRGDGDFSTDYHKMHIYVSEKATKNSPIILMVKNSGWLPSAVEHKIEDGKEYVSNSDTDVIGAALNAGYVIVSMGTRSRGLIDEDGNYVGHSPAVVVDTKAGIRYLRYNDKLGLLPAGDTDRIIITGTSGGGGLSAIVAASGNSPDYYPYLYEIGAAGIIKNSDGSYTSSINDDVFATVAYCPITDFDGADMAYEWTYYETRVRLRSEDESEGAANSLIYGDSVLAASKELKDAYPAYLNKLGLKLEDGTPLTADNFEDAIIALLEKEIEEAYIERGGKDALLEDIEKCTYNDYSWLEIDDKGNVTIDYDEFLYFVAKNTELKTAPAFSNYGTPHQHFMNEDNLFGAYPTQEYSPFEFWSWNNHSAEVKGVGKNNTGLSWDEYIKTDEGKTLLHQLKMLDPIAYLIDDSNGDSAPYWYVRHGMKDRDTSFAVEALLYYAMINDSSIRDVNFEFTWLQGHGGNYDVQEAYKWIAGILEIEKAEEEVAFEDVNESDWFFDAVKFVNLNGIMKGVSATTFAPRATTTRAMIVTILHRLEGVPMVSGDLFKDVLAGQWYTDAVVWAAQNGIVKGYGNDLFGPNDPITREQMASILYNYAKFKGYDTSARANLAEFSDTSSVSSWAVDALSWANAVGIISGMGNNLLAPKGNAERAQVAAILMRFIENIAE